MHRFHILTLAVSGIVTLTAAPVQAQYLHSPAANQHRAHHDQHVFGDRHGHVIGGVPEHALYQTASCVVPSLSRAHAGSYYARDGQYYYTAAAADLRATGDRPSEITFGGFSHVDDLAMRLEDLANQLCLDLFYNYSHNLDFRETYGEAYQVLDVARFIHDSEHRQDRDAIRQQLQGLDDLFHHVQDDVRSWSRHHRRQIGALGMLSKMELLESTLHHLMNDVGVSLTPEIDEQAPRPDGREQAPPPLKLPAAPRP